MKTLIRPLTHTLSMAVFLFCLTQTQAKDANARVEAVRKISALDAFLSSSGLDANFAKFFILNEATPAALSDFAAKGAEQKKLIDALLA